MGLIEGATEFLPISSTAHLILAERVFGLPTSEALSAFTVAIQSGAVLAVFFNFGLADFFKKWGERIFWGFLPTAILGALLYKTIKPLLAGNLVWLASALLFGGIIFIALDFWRRKQFSIKKKEEIFSKELTKREAFLIGLSQTLAFIPGVSRSGATLVTGFLLGVKKEQAVKFSFLLAVPTVLSAAGLSLIDSFSLENWPTLLVGFLASFLSGALVIKTVLFYLSKFSLWPYGLYRIALALIVFLGIL